MRKLYLKLGLLIVLCTGAAFALGQHMASSPARDADPRAAQAYPRELTATESRDRAEQRRDLVTLRKALVQQVLSADLTQAKLSPADPVEEARDTLDQRMLEAAPDGSATASMENALRTLLASDVLGDNSADFTCGSRICRVDLAGEDDATLEASTQALAERMPKTFASLAIYPQGTGERAMYLARSSSDLELGPQPTKVGGSIGW